MNSSRHVRVPEIDRKALWVVRELGLPVIVRSCVSCGSDRHRPTGKFRVNANHKLLDVWMLIGCERCGRTAKIPIHERINVRAVRGERLQRFENNDTELVRRLTMDTALAGRSGYRLDWQGTWELETDLPFYDIEGGDPAPLQVLVRYELPVPVRVERLVAAGFGLSGPAVRVMAGTGRIRLPLALEAKARADFAFSVC